MLMAHTRSEHWAKTRSQVQTQQYLPPDIFGTAAQGAFGITQFSADTHVQGMPE